MNEKNTPEQAIRAQEIFFKVVARLEETQVTILGPELPTPNPYVEALAQDKLTTIEQIIELAEILYAYPQIKLQTSIESAGEITAMTIPQISQRIRQNAEVIGVLSPLLSEKGKRIAEAAFKLIEAMYAEKNMS